MSILSSPWLLVEARSSRCFSLRARQLRTMNGSKSRSVQSRLIRGWSTATIVRLLPDPEVRKLIVKAESSRAHRDQSAEFGWIVVISSGGAPLSYLRDPAGPQEFEELKFVGKQNGIPRVSRLLSTSAPLQERRRQREGERNKSVSPAAAWEVAEPCLFETRAGARRFARQFNNRRGRGELLAGIGFFSRTAEV
jgi:hypothetical protein